MSLLKEGTSFFNHHLFYESHEAWEQIWLHNKSSDRIFYQGLILLAAAFCHFQKRRLPEALKALKKAHQKLSNSALTPHYLEWHQLEGDILSWIKYLKKSTAPDNDKWPAFPVIYLK